MSHTDIPTSWRDRLAVINEFQLSNASATTLFNTTDTELETARSLVSKGLLTVPALSVESKQTWQSAIASVSSIAPVPTSKVIVSARTAVEPVVIVSAPKIKRPQPTPGGKRGRIGNKIITALNAIPSTPQSIDAFVTTYGISKTVLRQSKRFLDSPIKVSIKKDKVTGVEMICRK